MNVQSACGSSNTNSTLARSRSRYKGHRSTKDCASRSGTDLPVISPQNIRSPLRKCGDINDDVHVKSLRAREPDPHPPFPTERRSARRNHLHDETLVERDLPKNSPPRNIAHERSVNHRRHTPPYPNEGIGMYGVHHSLPKSERMCENSHGVSTHMPSEYAEERGAVPMVEMDRASAPATPRDKPKHNETSIEKRQQSSHKPRSRDRNIHPPSKQSSQLHDKPAFDAPVSAVNAGERRVAVEFGKSVVSVPVTTFTTAVDVISAAAFEMGKKLDADTSIVLESFRQLGLERPLRKYEHVRDILNSWDYDAQNALIILPSRTNGTDSDLEVQSVSEKQPGDTLADVYYSQRPHHWEKQNVNLRGDGQVTTTRKGTAMNICHLSDFDIYIPTKRQLSRTIKPPKKICFAIKSQQKSSMFLSTENFVHFFCTSDKVLAANWYAAVQGWRSWYLVNVMGKGRAGASTFRDAQVEKSSQDNPDGRVLQQATTYTPSQGLAQPGKCGLVNTPHMKSQEEQFNIRATRKSTNNRSEPPRGASAPRSASIHKKAGTVHSTLASKMLGNAEPHQTTVQEPFAATGLLGRTYTQRKKAQEDCSGSRDDNGVPPTPDTVPWRDLAQQTKPMPLIDLTPQQRELPQHRKWRGISPEQLQAAGLVEAATSPERPAHIPPPPAPERISGPLGAKRSGTVRSRYHRNSPAKQPERQETRPPEEATFGKGLLSTGKPSQGDLGHGRGIQTGDRNAKTPMVDMTKPRQYAPGSLLASVEKHEGGHQPVIQREKRREVNSAIGELR